MEIPYDEFELRMALFGASRLLNSDEKVECIREKLEKRMKEISIPETKKALNEAAAAYHGISVLDLINSPNYQILSEEYTQKLMGDVIKVMAEEAGLSEKQAWAVFAWTKDLI